MALRSEIDPKRTSIGGSHRVLSPLRAQHGLRPNRDRGGGTVRRAVGRIGLGAAVFLIAVALAAVAVGAFSGDSDKGAAASSSERNARGAPPSQAELTNFKSCLEQHGVQAPDQRPANPQDMMSNPDFQRAFAACRSLLPQGGPPGQGGPPAQGGPSGQAPRFGGES
jgi:hypothetical protein